MLERGFLFALALGFLLLLFLFLGALHFAGLGNLGALANAVRNEADRIEPAHVLLLEKIDRVALPLGKQRDEHIRTRHIVAARRLDMEDRALDDPLKPARWRWIGIAFDFQRFKFGLEIMSNGVLELAKLDAAGDHDLRGMFVVDQRIEQVLKRCIFMFAAGRGGKRVVQRGFQFTGKRRHSMLLRSSMSGLACQTSSQRLNRLSALARKLTDPSIFWLTRAISASRIATRSLNSLTDKGSRSCFTSKVSGSRGRFANISSMSMAKSLTEVRAKSIRCVRSKKGGSACLPIQNP